MSKRQRPVRSGAAGAGNGPARAGAEATPGLDRLTAWCVGQALPLWCETGFDAVGGHFVEGLTLAGAPETAGRLRVRTAARQIYVYAHAGALGLGPADGLQTAQRAFERLHACAWLGPERPGYARVIDRRDGTVVDPVRDLYDQACVLLALAWLLRATGEGRYRDRADDLLAAIDADLAAPAGGWAEDDRGTLPRRQNPHMHMFEALLALCEASGRTEDRARLERLHALFAGRFVGRDGILCEHFGPRWEKGPRHGSDRLDPGHMAEWVWLLRCRDVLTGSDSGADGARLLEAALSLGRDGAGPFLLDAVDRQGTPLEPTRRLWPQAELIKARLARFDATGKARHLRAADGLAEALLSSYLADTPPGTWRDRFATDGRMVATSIPASSNYHLWTAVAYFAETRSGPARQASSGRGLHPASGRREPPAPLRS